MSCTKHHILQAWCVLRLNTHCVTNVPPVQLSMVLLYTYSSFVGHVPTLLSLSLPLSLSPVVFLPPTLFFFLLPLFPLSSALPGPTSCRQGTAAECAYIVLNGRLRSVVKKNDGKREMVEEHGRGETVGLVGGQWEGQWEDT